MPWRRVHSRKWVGSSGSALMLPAGTLSTCRVQRVPYATPLPNFPDGSTMTPRPARPPRDCRTNCTAVVVPEKPAPTMAMVGVGSGDIVGAMVGTQPKNHKPRVVRLPPPGPPGRGLGRRAAAVGQTFLSASGRRPDRIAAAPRG